MPLVCQDDPRTKDMRTAIFGSMSVAFVSRKGLGVTETVRASSTDDRSLIISLIEYSSIDAIVAGSTHLENPIAERRF